MEDKDVRAPSKDCSRTTGLAVGLASFCAVWAIVLYPMLGESNTIYAERFDRTAFDELSQDDNPQSVLEKLGRPLTVRRFHADDTIAVQLEKAEIAKLSDVALTNLGSARMHWWYSSQGHPTSNWKMYSVKFNRDGALTEKKYEFVMD